MENFLFTTLIYGLYLLIGIIIVKLIINPFRRMSASNDIPDLDYIVDNVGYGIKKNDELEIIPIRTLQETNSGSDIIPDKFKAVDIRECDNVFLKIPEQIENHKVTSIGKRGLHRCEKTCYITLPSTIRQIKEEAFAECFELHELHIPDGVTSIGDSAFRNCISLENITLGSGLKKLGSCVFADCSSLSEIHCKGLPPKVGAYTFTDKIMNSCKLYVKAEYIERYKKAADWKHFKNILTEQ